MSEDISLINFSPDQTKLVIAAEYNSPGCHEYWFIVIDLITNQSSWFKQEKRIKYAAFADNSTILFILQDGAVSFQELTAENLENNRVTNIRKFNVIEKADDCD